MPSKTLAGASSPPPFVLISCSAAFAADITSSIFSRTTTTRPGRERESAGLVAGRGGIRGVWGVDRGGRGASDGVRRAGLGLSQDELELSGVPGFDLVLPMRKRSRKVGVFRRAGFFALWTARSDGFGFEWAGGSQ